MNFLIIDDDSYKVSLFTNPLNKEDSYTHKYSYNSGLRELFLNKNVNYDCLILDMNFPTFDDECVEVDKGIQVLKELKRKKINIPVIIYSSKYVCVDNYENVIDYILHDGCDLNNRIKCIKDKLKG